MFFRCFANNKINDKIKNKGEMREKTFAKIL